MAALFEPRQAGNTRSMLGESPFWHPVEQVLYHCDIAGRMLRRFDPATGGEKSWELPSEPGCCAPIASGGILMARRDGLFAFDTSTGVSSLIAASPCPDQSVERFNDGKCDDAGRFWCGTVYEPKTSPQASLYCLERGAVDKRANSIMTSNGVSWSPDGRTMYWSDTPAHTIYALDFDVASGRIGERRVFKRFVLRNPAESLDHYEGRPDGAAVDSHGNYWVAMFEGARLLQLSPTGEVLREVMLPVQCPTMPCFGGPDLKTLYLTTASAKRPEVELAAQPLAGHVLAIDVEVPGLACGSYRM